MHPEKHLYPGSDHGDSKRDAGKKDIPSHVSTQLVDHLGEQALTVGELEVLSQLSGGNRNRDIALSLSKSEETVKVHVSIEPRQLQSPRAKPLFICKKPSSPAKPIWPNFRIADHPLSMFIDAVSSPRVGILPKKYCD